MTKYRANFWAAVRLVILAVFSTAGGTKTASGQTDRDIKTWPPQGTGESNLTTTTMRQAKNYYVILDGSGSMKDKKCSGDQSKATVAVNALQKFASAVPSDANLGLLVFDRNGTRELLPLRSGNREAFQSALGKLEVGGGTPLKTAIEKGLQAIETQARAQLGYGEYNIVVVTDGDASRKEEPETIVETITSRTPVILQTIGFCIGTNHALNQPGRTVYRAANNPKELVEGLESVLAESESFDIKEFK